MDEETARIIGRMQRELEALRAIEIPPGRCAARYTTNAGQSIPNGSFTIVDFEDIRYDTHTAVTTGASWKFTCPTGHSGYYRVAVALLFTSSATWAATEYAQASLYKGGIVYSHLARNMMESATTTNLFLVGADEIYLASGEYIDIRLFQNSGAALALHTDGLYNHVAISKK